MSKGELKSFILRELEEVNSAIDRKIVRGQAYTREARRHRELINKLSRVRNDRAWSRVFGTLLHS